MIAQDWMRIVTKVSGRSQLSGPVSIFWICLNVIVWLVLFICAIGQTTYNEAWQFRAGTGTLLSQFMLTQGLTRALLAAAAKLLTQAGCLLFYVIVQGE